MCEPKCLISNQQKKIEGFHNLVLGMQSEMSDMKDVIMHLFNPTVGTPLFVAQLQSGNSTIARLTNPQGRLPWIWVPFSLDILVESLDMRLINA